MSVQPAKPVPLRTGDNAPFLDGLMQSRVLLPRCGRCSRFHYPAARFCPHCLSEERVWTAVTGRGRIYSFIIVHQVYQAAFEADVPYNVAVVELDEGPRLTTNIVGCANHEIRVGMRVEPEFVRLSEDATLLKFRLTAEWK
jgi:uncharacterized OB-fold protein